jgi:divalent metal cation (Fe/Co/Zn/Cd) transporter
MKTQTVTNLADVAVGVFLLIGVVSGDRPPDEDHPLGYGRERFFWSFIAAAGIFVGGFGAAVAETVQTALPPAPTGSYRSASTTTRGEPLRLVEQLAGRSG